MPLRTCHLGPRDRVGRTGPTRPAAATLHCSMACGSVSYAGSRAGQPHGGTDGWGAGGRADSDGPPHGGPGALPAKRRRPAIEPSPAGAGPRPVARRTIGAAKLPVSASEPCGHGRFGRADTKHCGPASSCARRICLLLSQDRKTVALLAAMKACLPGSPGASSRRVKGRAQRPGPGNRLKLRGGLGCAVPSAVKCQLRRRQTDTSVILTRAEVLLPRLFGTNPRSHHKGATGRVRTGDQPLPVLCHCQLGQD